MNPFHFKTVFSLVVLTGERARTLRELCALLARCDETIIFYHTFRSYGSHHYMPGHFNDVAQWVHDALGIESLPEELSSIDVREHASIREIGETIVRLIGEHMDAHPGDADAEAARPFHLSGVVSTVMPIPYVAHDLRELHDMIGRVSNHSLYFHFVEARLRVGPQTNDFSMWIGEQLGLKALADRVNRIDIATSSMDDVRTAIRTRIEEHLAGRGAGEGGGAA
jgi:hypothetical protein